MSGGGDRFWSASERHEERFTGTADVADFRRKMLRLGHEPAVVRDRVESIRPELLDEFDRLGRRAGPVMGFDIIQAAWKRADKETMSDKHPCRTINLVVMAGGLMVVGKDHGADGVLYGKEVHVLWRQVSEAGDVRPIEETITAVCAHLDQVTA